MLHAVVLRPGAPINAKPLVPRHTTMRRADMLEVILVHVAVHRNSGAMELLVIFRAGQRREDKEFQAIDGKLALQNLNVAFDRSRGVLWEAQNIAAERNDTGRAPGL